MSQKNNAGILAKINAVFNNVDPSSITPQMIEELMEDIKDSYLNLLDHSNYFGLKEQDAGRTLPFTKGEAVHKYGAVWINRSGDQGALDATKYLQITRRNVLFDLDPVNTSTNYVVGAIVRYENRAFERKLAGAISNVEDVYDTDEFTQLNVPVGYYGEEWLTNSIYKEGMVVSFHDGSREVYLLNTSGTVIKSTNIGTEWTNGIWKYVGEVAPSDCQLVTGNITLSQSDTGKKFKTTGVYQLSIDPTVLSSDFFCELYTIGGSANFLIADIGGGSIVPSGKKVSSDGRAYLQKLSGIETSLSGDIENV